MIVLESAAVFVCVTGTEPTEHGSAQVPVAAPVAVYLLFRLLVLDDTRSDPSVYSCNSTTVVQATYAVSSSTRHSAD